MLADFTVRDGLWDKLTKVADVQRKRHTVLFHNRAEPSLVTYCNNCGWPFTHDGECAECGH